MRRPRGLVARVLLVATLGALLTVPVLMVPLAQWISEDALLRTLRTVPGFVEAIAEDCARRPTGWRVVRPGTVVYGYDSHGQRPSHPAAPPIDPELLARARAGETVASSLRWRPPFGGAVLVSTGRSGPCALLGLAWRTGAETSDRHLGLVLGLLVGLAFASGLGAILLAIWPLRRRIAALDRAAHDIGDAQRFRPVDDPVDDALGRLAQRITASHHHIVAAAAALDAHATALEDHLADVAHDVRTPLSALQLRLEALMDEGQTDARAGRVLAALDDVLYLSSLVENLRLGSRLSDPAARDAFDVDLGPIVRRVVDRFSALGGLRDVIVRGSWPDAPVVAHCDPAAAEQALTNLVQNAVVHGRPRGAVTVILDRIDAGFELAVVDDGPGVPPAALPRLAERRFRAGGARTRGAHGSGLGLAIVAAVCDRHGWTLGFDSLEPHGLRVVIRGPCADPGAYRAGDRRPRSTPADAGEGE